ncbi:helicase HerA domain-containing protein [Xanthomonas euvesicatoria]
MRHYFGLSEYHHRQQGKQVPVFYDPSTCLTGHLVLMGMSGSGKSFQSVRLMNSAAADGIALDVFDVHDELGSIQGAVSAKYSQATQYGTNPLVLDTDPHTGGVNRQADFFVGLIRQVTTQFGSKQEAALRNLILDCYAQRWIFPDNPRSWFKEEITEAHRRQLIADRRWQDLRNYYPTLSDLQDFAQKKVLAMLFGGDNKAMNALEVVCKQNKQLQGIAYKLAKAPALAEEKAKLEARLEESQKRLIDAFTEAVNAKPTREVRDLVAYDSKEVLISVVQRLEILAASGIFNANAAPFDGANVRVHEIKSLSDEQQVLFVKLKLRKIFEDVKKLGPTASGTELRHVVFLDEGSRFFSDEPDDIINVISREARKFGLGLWCAAQEPTSFPQSFITNTGAKIVLGIDASFWKGAQQKLRITPEGLRFIKAKEVMAVKLHKEGVPDPPFINVVVPNPSSEAGRLAMTRAA